MKINISSIRWLALLLFAQTLFAQKEKPQFSGYLKNLQNWSWSRDEGILLNDGFLHHRMVFKWAVDSSLTVDAEIRNRLFYGETVKYFPGYADLLDHDNGLWDGNFIPAKSKNLILSTQIDRLWLNWQRGRVDLRLGRQRINWGIATTWNPNDLFNAFNFLDFDYEERPGSDALRLRLKTGSFSSLEVALSAGKSEGKHIEAVRYSTNWQKYDWQLIAGRYYDQWTAGLGWAGNLGQAGFKGECSIFKSVTRDSAATLSLTAQIDHLFADGWYISGGFLYAGAAPKGDFRPEQLARSVLEPNRLMPVRWSVVISVAKPITPILNATLTVIRSHQNNLVLLVPALAYNIRENWDLDLIGQLFFLEPAGMSFANRYDAVFLRTRWSF